jgi:PilZ domain-containing protein
VQAETRRRSDRVLAPLPIRVIGNDANGTAFSEDAVTVSVNQQGARISMTHSLLVDDVILILNKKSRVEEEFRVVGAFAQVIGDRREWGVELLDPKSNIWEIEFTQPSEELRPKAIIECGGCHHAVQSPLSSIEYDVLLAVGMISRHCDRCKETTRWIPSQQAGMPEIIEVRPQPPGAHAEKRRAKRIKLMMRLRVRNAWGVVDVAQTRDVSKCGLCYLSNKLFSLGEEVFIILPFSANSVPVETKGRVVWSSPTTGGRYYGVEYLR